MYQLVCLNARPYFPFLLTVGNKVKPVGHEPRPLKQSVGISMQFFQSNTTPRLTNYTISPLFNSGQQGQACGTRILASETICGNIPAISQKYYISG